MRTGERRRRLPNWAIGLILVAVVAVASVYAFTKSVPWADKYTVEAVFPSATNVRPSSPVRIAGVNVGEVTAVEHLAPDDPALQVQAGDAPAPDGAPATASVVTMELEESALPLHTDATMKLRPRLFLEGNLFMDLKPGTPSAPEAEDGYTFPIGQTAIAIQLDEVLTTLQSDVRTDLQVLLAEFGDALTKHGGAEGFRELYRSSPGAFRYTSQVNEALLGQKPRDLSELVVNLDSTVEALNRPDDELQDLVTNLRVVLGSFAAEDEALEQAIIELPGVLEVGRPALASLNSAFPSMRAFAREALPGVRSTPATLDAATPLLREVRGLVSEAELRGLVADLRPTIPRLTDLVRETIPFLRQGRPLSSCFNEVIIPWSNDRINDPSTQTASFLEPGENARVYEELGYGLTGIASESRSGDANGPYIRVLAGGGTNTIVIPDGAVAGEGDEDDPTLDEGLVDAVGVSPLPINGAIPTIESSAKTPFRQDVACETQEPPDLAAQDGLGPADQSMSAPASPAATPEQLDSVAEANDALEAATRLLERGRTARGQKLRENALDALNEGLAGAYGLEHLLSSPSDGGEEPSP